MLVASGMFYRGLFDKDAIAKMKKGAYLVNNARGGIVDRQAVLDAVVSGHLGGAKLAAAQQCHLHALHLRPYGSIYSSLQTHTIPGSANNVHMSAT